MIILGMRKVYEFMLLLLYENPCLIMIS